MSWTQLINWKPWTNLVRQRAEWKKRAIWIEYQDPISQERGGVFLYDRPFCASCSDSLIQIDEDGEYVVKEEYEGKITYQEGDFIEEEQEEHRTGGIFLEYCEN